MKVGLAATVTSSSSRPNTYSGPKAWLVTAPFDCIRGCGSSEGKGFADALITSLLQTQRYEVFETSDSLGRLLIGDTKGVLAPECADIAVVGTITEWNSGAGTGGTSVGIPTPLGNVNVGGQTASISIDLRLVEIKTRRVVATNRVEGRTSDVNLGVRLLPQGLGANLSTYRNTPMEKAIFAALDESVKDIIDSLPSRYYINKDCK